MSTLGVGIPKARMGHALMAALFAAAPCTAAKLPLPDEAVGRIDHVELEEVSRSGAPEGVVALLQGRFFDLTAEDCKTFFGCESGCKVDGDKVTCEGAGSSLSVTGGLTDWSGSTTTSSSSGSSSEGAVKGSILKSTSTVHLTRRVTISDLATFSAIMTSLGEGMALKSSVTVGSVELEVGDHLKLEGALEGATKKTWQSMLASLEQSVSAGVHLVFDHKQVKVSEGDGAAAWRIKEGLQGQGISVSGSSSSSTIISPGTRNVMITRSVSIMNFEFLRVLWAAMNSKWVVTKSVKEGFVEIEKGERLLAQGSMTGKQLNELPNLKVVPAVLVFERSTIGTSSSEIKGSSVTVTTERTVTTSGGSSTTISGALTSGGGQTTVDLGTLSFQGCACCPKVEGLRGALREMRVRTSEEIVALRLKAAMVGPPGAAGLTCRDGTDVPGPVGPPGPDGMAGEPGMPGLAGMDGTPGADGTAGTPGARGAPGKDGADGEPGSPGSSGPAGASGEAGADGAAGMPGTPGMPGDRGGQGTPGFQGPKGPPGKQLGDEEEVFSLTEELLSRVMVSESSLSMLGEEKNITIEGGWTNAQVKSLILDQMVNVDERVVLVIKALIGSMEEKLVTARICGCPQAKPGPHGAAGEPGKAGMPGEAGAQGDGGLEGPGGEDGAAGLQGPPGPPGQVGEPGAPGQDGAHAKGGLPGRDGLPGFAGADGEPGEKGADGDPGVVGAMGAAGEPGRAGADGRDGLPGEPGPDGGSGKPGPPGLDGTQGADGLAGPPGGRGSPGESGERGEDGADGSLGSPGSPGKPGSDGTPGPPGEEGVSGHEGLTGSSGPVGPGGKDGNPGKDGRDGPPGALGMSGPAGKDGFDGSPGEAGVGMPGTVGPPGPAGPPGEPPNLEDLGAAVDGAKEYVKKVTGTTTELAVRNTDLEHFVNQEMVIMDERTSDIMKLFTDMHVEVSQEVEEVAEETCRADFQARSTPCCPNCTKAEFRTPKQEVCAESGCSHSCAYVKMTCDQNGKKLRECQFPFLLDGEKQTECTTMSPFGEVTRPWCLLSGQKGVDAAEGGGEVGFCDCTEIKCTCPEGQKLKKDGITCH